ncbi:hypothetical protein BU17DRAFT_65432 [Hysterangium stoloniferum]|nr:hypothetical protein BU17DRAFT_65432 [Hysterangium stoloniferum]
MTPTSMRTADPVSPDGVVKCYHGMAVNPLTSNSVANPGRIFYTCFKNRDDKDKCGFFKWADDLNMPSSSGTPSSPPATRQKPTWAPNTAPFTPKATPHGANNIDVDDDEILIDEYQLNQLRDEDIDHDTESAVKSPPKKFKFYKPEEIHGRPSSSSANQPTFLSPASTQKKLGAWESIRNDPSLATDRDGSLSQRSSPANAISIDGITNALESLASSVPEIIRKLERQRNAAEKSRDAKATRITQLEKEMQEYGFTSGLKDRNRSLEDAIQALVANR